MEEHKLKAQNLQKELLAKLNELETLKAKEITSESIHTGFNTARHNGWIVLSAMREKAPGGDTIVWLEHTWNLKDVMTIGAIPQHNTITAYSYLTIRSWLANSIQAYPRVDCRNI